MAAPKASYGRSRREALDADAAKVTAIFGEAALGRTQRLQDLYEDTRMLDSRLDAVAAKRILAVQGRPILLSPPEGLEGDKEAKRVAEAVGRIFRETPHFRQGIGHLAHGIINGYAVAEIDWQINARGEYVPALQPRHPNRFGWNDDIEIVWCDYGDRWPGVPLSCYPDKFVVHSPSAGRSTYPWRRGAIRARVLPSLAKRHGIRWWLELLERWGQPQVWATVPEAEPDPDGDPEAGDSLSDATLDALRDLSTDWQAVFSEGIEPKTIEMSGKVTSDLHATFVEYQNTEDSIAILGQNLTTEVSGGSFAATEVHRAVSDDILLADVDELAGDTIHDQIVEPTVRFNWPGAPVPRVEMPIFRRAAFTLDDVQEGIATEDEYRASKGYEAKPGGQGREYREPASQVQVVADLEPSQPKPTVPLVF